MRLFYAVKFTDHVKESLDNSIWEIQKYTVRGNFTEKNNFHITLVFVGECEADIIENLKKVADKTVSKLNPAPVKAVIENLGTFKRPGDELLWAGVRTEPYDILDKISKAVIEELAGYNIKINDNNKKFTPHVTMARRIEFVNSSEEDIKNIKFTQIDFIIDSLTLMESVQEIKTYGERRYTKIIYNPVYEVKF